MPRRSTTDLEVQLPKSLDQVLERLSIRLAWTLQKEQELASIPVAMAA
jgi:hypothetical protein